MRPLPVLLVLAACAPDDPFPAPDAWEPTAGPGGPAATFTDAELWQPCAALTGGPDDVEHHNLVVVRDGYLWMPWAPEDSGGGLTVFAFDDPCAPVKVGEAWHDHMRESHTMAFRQDGDRTWLAVDYMERDDPKVGGVGFWDVSDPANPVWAGQIALPDFTYPDAYFYVTLSTFWQGPYVYASYGFNGVYVIDASDPTEPEVVGRYHWGPPGLLVGSFHVIGNVAMASSAGLARTAMMDVSDPTNPVPIPGGDFAVSDASGDPLNYYFANVGGEYGLFARKAAGGGPVLYDLSDPSAPRFVGHLVQEDGSGGYVFRHGDHLFQGESDYGAVYDIADPAVPVEVARFDMAGDLDTVTPVGNVLVASVDSGADPGLASVVIPWQAAPDADPPRVGLHFPRDGDVLQAVTSRIGVSFDEMIEAASVFPGSFRVASHRGEAVPGTFDVQENLVNFTPDEPLEDDTTYVVTLPAGGVTDVSGNALDEDVVFRFSTGERPRD